MKLFKLKNVLKIRDKIDLINCFNFWSKCIKGNNTPNFHFCTSEDEKNQNIFNLDSF